MFCLGDFAVGLNLPVYLHQKTKPNTPLLMRLCRFGLVEDKCQGGCFCRLGWVLPLFPGNERRDACWLPAPPAVRLWAQVVVHLRQLKKLGSQ